MKPMERWIWTAILGATLVFYAFSWPQARAETLVIPFQSCNLAVMRPIARPD